jgi:hypothetical protein
MSHEGAGAISSVSEYMFIATRRKGHVELMRRVEANKGQIVMKIPHGRIGLRERNATIEGKTI